MPSNAQRLLCDISRTGQLLEFGLDPLYQPADCKSLGVQTEVWSKDVQMQQLSYQDSDEFEDALSKPAAASRILKLAVGLLGLDVHEKPQAWAEVWLTFKDNTARQLGLSSFTTEGADHREFKKGQVEWQQQVLSHLRQLRESPSKSSIGAAKAAGATQQSDAVPSLSAHAGYREQLELADFALHRITHAVNVLQNPEGRERPDILKEYTEERVNEVCTDLTQWLEQLAMLLSMYHVHLLDCEGDRSRLAGSLRAAEAKFRQSDEEKKDATRRFEEIEARWNEEKMKRRAEALFGVNTNEEDAKIYSQAEVDDMYEQWKKEQVDPLLEEIKALKKAQRELLARMQAMKQERTARNSIQQEEPLIGETEFRLLQSALKASSSKVWGDLGPILSRTAESLATCSTDMREILQSIQALPDAGPPEVVEEAAPIPDGSAVIDKETVEWLQTGLKATNRHVTTELASLLTQMGQCITSLGSGPEMQRLAQTIQKLPLPTAPALPEKPAQRSTGVNTTQAVVLPSKPKEEKEPEAVAPVPAEPQRDFEGELRRLREQLEEQLRQAKEEAERQRKKSEEAMKKLEEELKKAEQLIAELRRKLRELQELLQKAGLGKLVEEAMAAAGLSDFLKGRDVFERLYRDALRRMRTQAELQAKLTEESANQFVRTLHDLANHPLVALDAFAELHGHGSPFQVMRFSPAETPGESARLVPGAAAAVPDGTKLPLRSKTAFFVEPEKDDEEDGRGHSAGRVRRAITLASGEMEVKHGAQGTSAPLVKKGSGLVRTTSGMSQADGLSVSPTISLQSRPAQGTQSQTNLISARPLAAGPNWPLGKSDMAVEGQGRSNNRTASRGSDAVTSEKSSPMASNSPQTSPLRPRPTSGEEAPLEPLLSVSSIGPRPVPSQLVPKGGVTKERRNSRSSPGSLGGKSEVLRSAGSLAMPQPAQAAQFLQTIQGRKSA
mmetsp:Transcript_57272/g.133939  ORF Transcript_57272/g.133939 Transcript_57272/m.133939 type:complete len:953 (-) Transcript_57272:40-2898(-)